MNQVVLDLAEKDFLKNNKVQRMDGENLTLMNNVVNLRKELAEEASKMQDGEKLAVVAHDQVLFRFTCQEFDENNEPVKEKSIKFSNCEVVEWIPSTNTFNYITRK